MSPNSAGKASSEPPALAAEAETAANGSKTGTIDIDESSIGSALPPDAESLLQEEMMKLSLQDRNQTQEEIHGVHCRAHEETPEFLQESLRKLDVELKENKTNQHRLTSEQTMAFRMSQELYTHKNKHTYVNSDEFRLRFLRCELFDISMAAYHMHRFLAITHRLFGDVALQRPIRISDFSKAELREFRKGRTRFLPFRDRAGPRGRRILAVLLDAEWEQQSPALKTKIWIYLMYAAGEDLHDQKNGIVVLLWFDPSWEGVSKRPLVSSGNSRYGVAIRVSSVHLCTPDTPLYRFRRSIMVMRLGQEERSRVKIHVGKSVELMYTLQGFGIPIDYIPVSFTGKIKEKYAKEWIRLRQRIEEERVKNPEADGYMIELPYLDDIVFRNGTSLLSHPGNTYLRSLITAKVMHEDSKKKNTKELVSEVIAEIKGRNPGGDNGESNSSRRFLIWNEKECFWKEVPPENEEKEIHSKLSRIVRDTRKLVGSASQKTAQQEAKVASRSKASTAKRENPLPITQNIMPIKDQQGHGTYMFVHSNVAMSHKRQKISPNRDCFGFEACDGVQWFCT